MDHSHFMRRAAMLAHANLSANLGGPFGAVVVRDGAIIAEGCNEVTGTNDPTAHAEVVAIRRACARLQMFRLDGCDIYTNCEPCPMCLGAIHWARVSRIYHVHTREDAARIGFDDERLYRELALPPAERSVPATRLVHPDAPDAFAEWLHKADRTAY